MDLYLVDSPIGLFFINDKQEIIERYLYPRTSAKAADEFSKLLKGLTSRRVLKSIKKIGESPLTVENMDLEAAIRKIGINVEYKRPCRVIQTFREQLPNFLIEEGVFKDSEEWRDFEREFAIETAKIALAEKAAYRDLTVIQAVRAVDDIDKTLNLFSGIMREWYGLHFPELDKLIEPHERYARFIVEIGDRGSLSKKKLKDLGFEEGKSDVIAERGKLSLGAEISQEDLTVLQEFCQHLIELQKFRESLENHIEKTMERVAPNLSNIMGATISARLISLAGGLEKLARMPASTIQVLGAEKALFRSIKTGSRPPKHGVIFQYAAIHQSPRWQRGKIARALAGKLAIAARLDTFAGEYKGEELRKGLDKRIEEIRSQYPRPPVKKAKKRERKARRRR